MSPRGRVFRAGKWCCKQPEGRFATLRLENASEPGSITLYLHGQGGNRRQGVNDRTFGGNFNRIQNLMVRAKGLYLSPDVGSFDAAGIGRISELILHYAKQSPGAPIFVACGSMGGALCWGPGVPDRNVFADFGLSAARLILG